MTELIPTPKWVTDFYDPYLVKPHYTVEVTDDGFLLHEIDLTSFNPYTFQLWELEANSKLTGKTVLVTGALEDLYNWSQTYNVRPVGTPGTEFAKILAADPNYVVPMVFGMPSTSISMACEVASTYKDFLKIVEDFEKNPTDSVIAFKFIDNHPMYWHFNKFQPRTPRRRRPAVFPDGTPYDGVPNPAALPEPRIELVTGRGWARVELQIIQGKFSFETSGTPFHTQTNYHDYGLDVYSKNMDEGICELAAKIHASYDLDGNLRNGDEEPNRYHG
jgi:hypothetical protein